jgi:archaellum component FlaF (FlaF/FlaG flagellin family)
MMEHGTYPDGTKIMEVIVITNKLLSLLIMVGILFVGGCQSREQMTLSEKSSLNNIDNETNTGLEINVEQASYNLPVEKVILEVNNLGDDIYIFGAEDTIEKFHNGSWFKIPYNDDIAFPAIGYSLKSKESKKLDIYLKQLDYQLDQGKYRVIKNFSTNETTTTLSAEFELH